MSSKNYIIPTEDLTLTDKSDFKRKALAAGILRCYQLKIAPWDPSEIPSRTPNQLSMRDVYDYLVGGSWPSGLDVREFQPIADAGAALDQWNTPALAAIGTEYSVFQAIPVPAIGLRATKLVVWYKVLVDSIPLPVSRLVFRKTAAAGSIMAQFDLEQLAAGQRLDGYLSEPQIWDPNLPYAINVMARIVAGVSRIVPGNFVFEPAGSTNI